MFSIQKDLFNTVFSVISVQRLQKEWNILLTCQQKHDTESIFNQVYDIRKRFPLRGAEGIRKTLRQEYGINVPQWERLSEHYWFIHWHRNSDQSSQIFSKLLNWSELVTVAIVVSRGSTSGLQASMIYGHKTNTTSGVILAYGYMLD